MSQALLTLRLPDDVYEQVRRAAKGMKAPVEAASVRIVQAATPSLQKVPRHYRAEPRTLEDASDERLRQVASNRLSRDHERQLADLLDKNQRGKRTGHERQALKALRTEADRTMLRRAYATLLFKYRGLQVPESRDCRL